MGIPAQPASLAAARRGHGLGRRGLALPSAMFALVAIAVLVAGLFVFADLNAKAVENRERATRAQHVAEAGVNHALGLLRGSLRSRSFTQILRGADGLTATAGQQADDSLFINWPGLSAQDQIPLAGQSYQGHTYFVTVADDPADTDGDAKADMNGRVLIRCRAVTTEGATAEVQAIVGAVPMPGVTIDGDLTFGGNSARVTGACGGAHANGSVNSAGPGPTIETQVSATVAVNGNYRRPDNTPTTELNGMDPIYVPDLNPMSYCAGADFTLQPNGGGILNVATGLPVPLFGSGWTWDLVSQSWKGVNLPNTSAGTYCALDDVWIAGATGTEAAPFPISVLSTGSIKVDGTPYIIPDHPDGILLLAAGDIYLAGNTTAGITAFTGMVYAGAQCAVQGTVEMFGQLVCANGAQPAGAIEWAPGNLVAGNFKLNFDCSGNVFNKRRVLFWYPRIGV